MFNYINYFSFVLVLLSSTVVAGFDEKSWEEYKKHNPKPLYDNPYTPDDNLPPLLGFTRLLHKQTQDLKNYVGIANNITREKAAAIANENPEITYFVYHRTGPWYYLENIDVLAGITHQTPKENFAFILDLLIRFDAGDVIFFMGEPTSLLQAPGVSDVYIKE